MLPGYLSRSIGFLVCDFPMSVVRAIRPNTATKITNRFQPMYSPLKNVLLQPIVAVRPALYLSQKILVNKVFRSPPAQYPDHFGDGGARAAPRRDCRSAYPGSRL